MQPNLGKLLFEITSATASLINSNPSNYRLKQIQPARNFQCKIKPNKYEYTLEIKWRKYVNHSDCRR